MEIIFILIKEIFVYCTDFIINLTNLLGVSYYEVNALFFVIIWPLLTIALVVLNISQRRMLKKQIKKQIR